MCRLSVVALVAVAAALPAADAQRRAPRANADVDPGYWVGISLGYLEGMNVYDGASGSTWQFGYTSQIRATFEKTIQRGVTAGLSAGFSTAPLTHQSDGAFSSSGSCGGTCLADADIAQYLAFVRGGGGLGFHPLYNVEAGVTQFSNFRDRSAESALPPTMPAYDFTFGLGGGLGYGFTPTIDGYVGEQFDVILHPAGSSTTTASAPRQFTFRAGVRVGF